MDQNHAPLFVDLSAIAFVVVKQGGMRGTVHNGAGFLRGVGWEPSCPGASPASRATMRSQSATACASEGERERERKREGEVERERV